MRLSKLAAAAHVAAMGAMLKGGTFQLLHEPAFPDDPEQPLVETAVVLAEVQLPEAYATEGSEVVFQGMPEVVVKALGIPTRYRVLSKDGVVCDGTAGTDALCDFVLPLEAAQVYPGMRIMLTEFRHTVGVYQ